MPNTIKYSASAQTLALKKGNFWIGTGDVPKGPTSSTDYWSGYVPPAGGYTIYLNKASNGPSIYAAVNDTQLIDYTNRIVGTSYTTANECLNYYTGQTDKMVINTDYPSIITNGLVMNLDAGFTPSYPKNGTTWYDTSSGGNNGSLVNGPTYSSDNGGSIVFDGSNDRVECGNFSVSYLTVSTWVYRTSSATNQGICRKENGWAISQYNGTLQVAPGTSWTFYNTGYVIPLNTWVNITYTYNGSGGAGSQIVYINGVSIYSTSAGSGPIFSNSNTVRVGYDDNNWFWGGRIANTLIYNRSLTSTEVLQNYNAMAYLGSRFNPANSASAILSSNPSAPDGYYWINTTLGPRQLYCIMSLGGWMGITSEISPQIANLSTSASWESNTSGRLQFANPQILNVTVQEGNCGAPTYYSLRKPSEVGINYTQTMLLINRISTIGQCSYITNTVSNGWYNGPVYSGSYTSSGMCTWGDGIFANDCCGAQNMTNLKPYWVIFGQGGSNFDLTYQVQCAGGTGQHYHMWFVK